MHTKQCISFEHTGWLAHPHKRWHRTTETQQLQNTFNISPDFERMLLQQNYILYIYINRLP